MTYCVAVAAGVVGALEVFCCGVDTDVALYFIPALGDWDWERKGGFKIVGEWALRNGTALRMFLL